MATEADIPETISVAKKEEGKELISDCLNTTANEISLEGMNKVEPWHNETPETIKILEKSADTQVETKTEVENVNDVIEGNVETIEGENFLGSPLVTKVAHEETSRVADDYQAAEKPTQAEKEVPKNVTIREDKLENQHVEIVENKEASLEKFKQNTFEELRSSEKDEKGVAMTEEKTDSESHKQTLDMLVASSGQNAGALVQTPDLTEDENMDSGKLKEASDKEESIDSAFSTKTPSIEENKREASFQEGEEKEPEASSHSMGKEMDIETIQPSKSIENKKNEGEEMPPDATKDVCISTETASPDNQKEEEATENCTGPNDKTGSPLITTLIDETSSENAGLDVGGKLEDNSSIAFEERRQEAVEPSEKMRSMTFIQDEIEEKSNSESSFDKKMEDVLLQKVGKSETFKEVPETGADDIVKERENEVKNQNEIIENTVIADSSLSSTYEDDGNPEPKFMKHEESSHREGEELAPVEASTVEYRDEEPSVIVEDNIEAAEHSKSEMSKHRIHPEHSFLPENEPGKEKLENSLDMASEEIQSTASNEHAETNTQVEEQRPIESPEDILDKTRKGEEINADDINKKEIPEKKTLSTSEKTETAEVEIPNKEAIDLYVTHPHVDVTIQTGGEKLDKVPTSVLDEQFHETDGVPIQENRHVNEAHEASNKLKRNSLDQTANEGKLEGELTSGVRDMEVDKLEKVFELDSEEKLQVKDAANNTKEEMQQEEEAINTELQRITTKGDNEKSKTDEDEPVKGGNKICSAEGADQLNFQENENGKNNSEAAASELNDGERSYEADNETDNNDRDINKEVKDPEQEAPENTETTESDKDTETVRSKAEEDLNSETEASALTKPFWEEESKKASEKPVDVSSTVPEEIEEMIKEEKVENADICNDNTDAAATVVTKETSLWEIQQDDKSVKASDTIPDSEIATIQTTETSLQGEEIASMKLDESYRMVYQPLKIEETSHETGTSLPVAITDTDEIEEEIKKYPEAISEPRYNNVEAVTHGEITSNQTLPAEKLEDETETIKEKIIDGESCTKELPEISGGTANEVKDPELEAPENLETTDSNKDTETVRSKVEEDLNLETEASAITKPLLEEELKKASEKPVDVSSSVPEEIDAAATVVTKETSLGEIQQDDKFVKASGTSPDSVTLATIQTTETSLQGEEIASMKLEETTQMVYQPPKIEETFYETGTSLPVANTDTDEIEKEIKKFPEGISEPRYDNVEAVTDGEVTSNQTLPAEKLEDETETIKENIIDGESCTKELHVISGGTVNEVKDPELEAPENLETTDSNKDTETVRSKVEEDLNSETEASAITKPFLEEELKKASEKPVDASSTVSEEIDAAATVVTKETSLGEIQQDDKFVKASGTSPDSETLATIQTTETSLQGEEIASMKLEETTQMVYQPQKIEETSHETGTSIPVANTDTDETEEEIKQIPEGISEPRYDNVEAVTDGEVTSNQTLPAEKLEDETETIKENIIDGESCTKELHVISGGTVNEVKDPELEAPENLETTDSNKDTETVISKVEEDLNSETEASAITKPFLEEELKKASEKPVDASSTVSEEIDAAATVVPKETSLGEIQQDDKSVKASGTSPDSETLATIQTTETSLQGEEIASMKLEETTQMVYQPQKIEETSHETGTSVPVANTDTDEIEEEIKKIPEGISEPRYDNVEAVTDDDVTSNQTLPAEKLEDETETIKENIIDGESGTKELHVISGGTVNEVKDPELEAPENLETTDSNKDTETVRSKVEEDLNSETEASAITKPFLEEELKKASEKPVDASSMVSEEIKEKIKQQKVEDENNFIDKSDDAALVVTKEKSLGDFQQDDKSIKASDTSPDSETLAIIRTTETSLQGEEIASIKLEETSQMVYQPLKIEETSHETGTSLPVAITDTDEIEEEIKKIPEGISEPRYDNVEAVTDGDVTSNQTLPAEKLEDETETIKENIIDGESCTKELHVISGGTVNEVKDPEPEAPENLETTNSNKDIETVRSKAEEDLNSETDASAITKPFLEEELKKASEKPVVVSSSVPEEMEEKIKEEKVKDVDTCNDKTNAAATVVTKETSLEEIQQDDKSVKASDTSQDSETLAAIQTTETILQGEEIASMKLEETFQETGTSLPVGDTDTNEIEEEIKKVPEAKEKALDELEAGSYNHGSEASGTRSISTSTEEVKDPELEAPENLETADSNKDAERVRSKVEEDLNSEAEASAITKPLLEEELKKASEKPVDDSSSVPEEIEKKIKQEKVEDEDNFNDKSDDAAPVVTKETSLGEFQQDDKSVKASDTSPDSETLATINTTETSLQGEEIASIKLEETSRMVFPPLNIEETSHETGTSLPVANTDTDEIEEIKKYPEAISEPRYNNVEAVADGEVTSNQTLPAEKFEDETETIKEKIIDGESCTKERHVISGRRFNEIKEPEPEAPENLEATDSNEDTETVRSKAEEDLNSETEASAIKKPFLEEELKKASEKPVDVSSSVPEEMEEKIKEEKVEDADNCNDKTNAAATVVTKETSLEEIQQDDKSVKASDTSPDSETLAAIQTTETILQGEEIASMKLEETFQETGTSLPVGDTDTNEIEEEIKKVPEAKEKALDELEAGSYNHGSEASGTRSISTSTEEVSMEVDRAEENEKIKEKKIEGLSCTKELHMISDGTVNEVKDPELEPPENLETTDSNKDAERVRSKVEEDLNSETEASAITKPLSEEELKKANEKPMDVTSSVPEEIEEKIKQEKVEDEDNSIDKSDDAALVVTKEKSLGEIQQGDNSVKAFDTSPDSETLATFQTTETSLQGEEIGSIKLEENSQMVYQPLKIEETSHETGTSLPVAITDTDEIEEEIKKYPEAISEPRYNNVEAVTHGEVTSNQTLPAEKLEDETETIKEKIIDGESCTKELHVISGGTVNEVKEPEPEAPENLEATDSNKDTETVRSKAEEDLNSETEASAIKKPLLEEELKKASEKPVDVSSSVPEEMEEKIKEEKVEDADNCNDKTNAAATVVTKETSLEEIQQDDKSVKASDTSQDSETLAAIQTTETILQGEEIASMKLEETFQETGTSLPVGDTDTNEIEEEIKKVPEAKEKALDELEAGSYNHGSEASGTRSISTSTEEVSMEVDRAEEKENIKEKKIEGLSCTKELHMISDGTVNEVKDPELEPPENLETTDSNKDAERVRSKVEEDLNSETEASAITKPLLEEELKKASEKPVDVSSSVPEEIEEKIKQEKVEDEDNSIDKSDDAALVVTEEKSLGEIQQGDNSVKAFDTSPDSETLATIQTTETSLQGEEIGSIKLEENSQMVYQPLKIEETSHETGTSLPIAITDTDEIEEEIKKYPEAISEPRYNNVEAVTDGEVTSNQTLPAEKLEDKTKTIKEKIIDGESCTKELPEISGGTANEVKDPELEAPENLEKTDSNKDTETVRSKVEEDLNLETEASAITKPLLEEELKKASEKPVDVSSSVPEEIDAAATLVTKETSLGEIQQDDKFVKASGTSPDSVTLATIQTTETSLQGEEIASMKLEETTQMVYQPPKIEETFYETGTSLPVANTDTDEIEKEIKKFPEGISEPRYDNVEAVTDGEVTSTQTLPAEKLEDETETIKENILDGESCTKELHVISGGTVNEIEEASRETGTSLPVGNTDTDEIKEEIKKIPEAISEPRYNNVEAVTDGEVTSNPTLPAEKLEDETEAIKEKITDGETCTKELHVMSGGTVNEFEETSHETGTTLPVAITDTDEIEEEIKKIPEAISEPRYNNVEAVTHGEVTSNQTLPAEKLEDETETIKEKIIEGESLHVISGGTVNEVKDPDPEAPENLETTDSNKEIETVSSKVEEDLNSETEASAITKPLLEEELEKGSEKPVDVSSSVSDEIDAAATVIIKETSLGEVQQDDNSVKASDSSPDSETLAAIQTTETSLQGEEIASMKLEETSRMVYQPPKIEETSQETCTSLPVGNTDRDEIEEEIKKVPEAIEKALDELEAGSYNHGSEASGTRSISTSTEEVSAEVERAEENENIKEQKIEGESCTKELHLISGETVNEVKNPELEAPENLETTDSNKDTETVRSKAEEDLNSETEASAIKKPFLEEELKKASEKPVDVSSSVPEEMEEKIKEEKVEDADNCNDKTDAAATVVTKETSLGEIPQDDNSVNASDTSPDSETLATIQTTETSLQGDEIASMKLEEISQMVYQLPKIEHENAENESTDFKNSDSGEVEKAKNVDGVSESEDQCVGETHEIGTSLTVGKIDTNETEEEIKKVPETVSEPRYNSIEEGIDGEISNQTLPADKLEEQLQIPSSVLLFKEQDLDKITTIEKIEDGGTKNKETELDSMRLEETSAMESQLLTIEHENADQFSVTVEKSDADEIKLEQTKILDSVSESKVQSCEEIHETGRSLTMEKIGADKTEEEIKEVPATISGTRHQGVESATNDEMTPDQTLPAENLEDQLQGPSSASLYKEQERGTTTIIENIEDDSTKKDETEVDSIILEETSGMVSQLPTMDMNATVEKLDAGEMKIEETKTFDAVCESRDRGVEDIYETGTITVEKNDADKTVEEIKEAPETISEPRYQGVETVSDGEITPDQTLPAGEMDGQLHVPSSVLLPKEQEHETTATVKKIEDESTKKDEAELGNMKLEESSAMASQLPKIDREIADNMNVTVESSDADEVEAEVTKISIAAYDSRDRGVEEIHESGTSLTVGKTDTDKIEEIKEVPEIISGPKYQGVEAVTEVGITPEQTLPARKSEQQLQEPSSVFLFKERDHETTTTIEKIEDESTKKDHTQVNEDLDSSLATGTMEETWFRKEKPREIGVAELELKLIEETKKDSPNEAQKEESTALEEAPAVEPQVYVSEIINADLPSDSEKRYIQCSSQETLTGEDILDSENPNQETDDLPSSHSIVKEILRGDVAKNSSVMSSDEEMVTRSNQEDELRAEECSGEKTNEKNEITKKEISNKEFDELERTGVNKNVEEIIMGEDRAVENTYQVADGNQTANNNLLEEAEEGKNAKRAHTDLELKDQGDETKCRDIAAEGTALNEEVNSTEVVLVKPNEDRIGASDKEIVIRKDEELQNSNLDDLPVTGAAAEEAPDKRVGEKIEEVSELAPREPTYKIIKTDEENKETAMANTNNSESIMDDERPQCTSLELACSGSDVIEGLNLKEQEIYANEQSTLSHTDTSQKEMEDKERKKILTEKQHDLKFDEQKPDEVSIGGGGKNITCEGKHRHEEEPVKLSTRGNESKLDEAEVHNTITAIEGESQVQNEEMRLNVLADIKDSIMTISQQDGIVDLAEDNETTKDTQELKKTTLALSDQHSPRESDSNEGTEATISSGNKDVTPVQQDPIAKTFQNAEEGDLKAENASGAEPEEKGVECGEEKRMGDECEEKTEKSTSIESTRISLSNLLQGTTKETSQVAKHLTEERELVVNKEELQTENEEIARVEAAKTEDKRNEEVGGEEHKREDLGPDAPVMVEASRDVEVKIVSKKSHNLLSGVGSKVKHSIAKVKKVITGKASQCSHPKTESHHW